jgi:hypothetical protein
MPVRQRKPREINQQLVPLLLLAVGLVTTNRSATFLDDEATFLGSAAQPLGTIFSGIFSAPPLHDPSALYSMVMHFWLRWTGEFDYIRIPSILFFLAGMFLLSRASRQFTGASGGGAVIWLGVLWPLGFHEVRLAGGFSFSFFLIAALTLSYFKFLENQTFARWVVLSVLYAALICTNYFAWAILGCLAIDQALRTGAKEIAANTRPLLGISALLLVSFPLFAAAIRAEFLSAMRMHQGAGAILANAGFNLYSLFVSMSIAPWYWRFSVPAALAVVLCLVMVVRRLPQSGRRFLLFSAALIVLMALAGTVSPNDLLLPAPWLLLAVGVAIETAKPRWESFALAASLLIIGAMGWYGIYALRFYADLRFVEPWPEIAGDAAAKIGAGATVIADHPSFLFYLTNDLHLPAQNGPWKFEGLLPEIVKHPQVYSPSAWLAANRPASGKMVLVRGGGGAEGNEAIDQVARKLDQSCGTISSRLRVRDEGYKWKQKFFPQLRETQWKIEIREYDCDSSNSKEIYHIPAP